MKFKVEFDLDNSAFDVGPTYDDGRDSGAVEDTLRRVGEAVCHERGGMGLNEGDTGKVRDVNGNTIGKWEVLP